MHAIFSSFTYNNRIKCVVLLSKQMLIISPKKEKYAEQNSMMENGNPLQLMYV